MSRFSFLHFALTGVKNFALSTTLLLARVSLYRGSTVCMLYMYRGLVANIK